MNAAHLRALDAMGLTVWLPRSVGDTAVAPAPSGEISDVLPGVEVYPGKNPVAVVLVVTPRAFRVTMKTEDGVMMARILEAMKARKGAFAVRHIQADRLLEPYALAGYSPVLVFGEVAGTPPEGWVVMPSLDAMMEQPNLKGVAWQQLKPLVGTIGRDVR